MEEKHEELMAVDLEKLAGFFILAKFGHIIFISLSSLIFHGFCEFESNGLLGALEKERARVSCHRHPFDSAPSEFSALVHSFKTSRGHQAHDEVECKDAQEDVGIESRILVDVKLD